MDGRTRRMWVRSRRPSEENSSVSVPARTRTGVGRQQQSRTQIWVRRCDLGDCGIKFAGREGSMPSRNNVEIDRHRRNDSRAVIYFSRMKPTVPAGIHHAGGGVDRGAPHVILENHTRQGSSSLARSHRSLRTGLYTARHVYRYERFPQTIHAFLPPRCSSDG